MHSLGILCSFSDTAHNDRNSADEGSANDADDTDDNNYDDDCTINKEPRMSEFRVSNRPSLLGNRIKQLHLQHEETRQAVQDEGEETERETKQTGIMSTGCDNLGGLEKRMSGLSENHRHGERI